MAIAIWMAREALEMLQREGFYEVDDKGLYHVHPAVSIHARYTKIIKDFAGQLGLSPSARASLGLAAAQIGKTATQQLMEEFGEDAPPDPNEIETTDFEEDDVQEA